LDAFEERIFLFAKNIAAGMPKHKNWVIAIKETHRDDGV